MNKQKWLDKNGFVLGEIYLSARGESFRLIDYISSGEVYVSFLPSDLRLKETKVKVRSGDVLSRRVTDSYTRTVENKFCVGESFTSSREKPYLIWRGICRRVIKGYAELDFRWYNYSNFRTWYEEQPSEDGWEVDKDILTKRQRRLYSPETCCVVPREVNGFINIGAEHTISWSEARRRFMVTIGIVGGKSKKKVAYSYEKACEIYLHHKARRLEILREKYPELPEKIWENCSQIFSEAVFPDFSQIPKGG